MRSLCPRGAFCLQKRGVAIAQGETDLGNPGEEERVIPKAQLTESLRPWEVGVRAGSLSCLHKPRHRDPRRYQTGQRIEWVLGRFLWQTSGRPPTQRLFPQDGATILSGCPPPLPHVNEWSVQGVTFVSTSQWDVMGELVVRAPGSFLRAVTRFSFPEALSLGVITVYFTLSGGEPATWWRQCWDHDAKSRKQLASANSKGIPKGHTKQLKLQNE